MAAASVVVPIFRHIFSRIPAASIEDVLARGTVKITGMSTQDSNLITCRILIHVPPGHLTDKVSLHLQFKVKTSIVSRYRRKSGAASEIRA